MNLIGRPIITSMFDDDTYKFSQQMAFMELFPDAVGEYRFINRGEHRFNQDFLHTLQYQIMNVFPELCATDDEIHWLSKTCSYLKPWYLESLKNFRYDPSSIECYLDSDNNLVWNAKGKLHEQMMWEVKMMSTISEIYFRLIDTDWSMNGQMELAEQKARRLTGHDCVFTDFGTRRRRDYETQDTVVSQMKKWILKPHAKGGFTGTSNVHFSHKYGLIPKGTQAHEFYMSMQALEGIRNSNYYALNNWVRVYNGNLGIALTDTLGTEQFLKNFGVKYAKLFDGVRHDSGDPYWYTDLIVNHYKKLGINPSEKTIIYSNALSVDSAISIREYCNKLGVKCSFGIGTHFTNDFWKNEVHLRRSNALNMVIKLWSVNNIPVVKLSDDEGKVMGDPDAIRVTEWMVKRKPL